MVNVFPYLYEYVKINYFALCFLGVLLALPFLKYVIKIPRAASPGRLLAGIILLGLLLRIFWLGFSSHEPKTTWNTDQITENDLINIHAVDLTRGVWFVNKAGEPSGRRPIGYPMVLGLMYKLFGVHSTVAWVLHLIFFVITAYLIYLIAQLIFSTRIGLLAAFLFSIHPTSIYRIKLTTDEHLFLPLWYFGIFLILREIKGRKLFVNWFWYGIIFGYAAMTRTYAIFMPAVVGFASFLQKLSWRRIVLGALGVAFMMQLLNLPWAIRNYKAWGAPILYAHTTHAVYLHVNAGATPEGEGYFPRPGEPGFSEEFERARLADDVALTEKYAKREMIRWILGNPHKFLALGTARLLYFMHWGRKKGVWPLMYQYEEGAYDPSRPLSPRVRHFLEELSFVFYYCLFHFFILSLFWIAYRLFRRRAPLDPASLNCLYILGSCFFFWLLMHLIIYPDPKYRFPLEPFMIIVASYPMDYLLFSFNFKKVPRFGLKRDGKHD